MNIWERLKGMNYAQRFLLGAAGACGVLAASPLIPATAVIGLPVLGAIKITTALGLLATGLCGWAKGAPGHVPANTTITRTMTPTPPPPMEVK